MNKKDIALSVGGVIATMVLAYLLYRLQQRDSAVSAANLATEQANAQASQDAQQEQESQYLAELSPLSSTGNNYSGVSAVTSTSSTQIAPDNGDASTSTDNLITGILNAFAPSISAEGNTSQATVSSMLIPTVGEASAIPNIPLTVAQANAGEGSTTVSGTVTDSGVSSTISPGTTQSNAPVSTPVSTPVPTGATAYAGSSVTGTTATALQLAPGVS